MAHTNRRVRAYIGLGANLGDAAGTVAWAVRRLAAEPGIRVHRVSPLYATAPWGVTDQPEFRNAVVAVDVAVPVPDKGAGSAIAPAEAALGLLTRLKAIERDAGRRPGRRWGPRELDLDLLVFGRHEIVVDRPVSARSLDASNDPDRAARQLVVPHRDAGERLFVLAPLADLAPRLVPPGWSGTVARRRRTVAASEPADAVRVVGRWDASMADWLPAAGA
jgi:2-amino-4-hydroxy-6-hydroxymethyldihydropteridine diphosphokinase